MKIPVSPRNGPISPPFAAAAASSVRQAVVPTAIARPPATRVSRTAAAVSADTSHHSACIRCSSTLPFAIGRKVPTPT